MAETTPTRRSFLSRLFAGTLFVGLGSTLSAVVAYLFPPGHVLSGLGPQRLRVGRADELEVGGGTLVLFEDQPIWVVRYSERDFVALSGLCTHKGCELRWEEASRVFRCPCHEGIFDHNGNVISGLPRQPLSRFRVGVVDGELYVSRDERQV